MTIHCNQSNMNSGLYITQNNTTPGYYTTITTTDGTSTHLWYDNTYTVTNNSTESHALDVRGDATFHGKIKIGDRDLGATLNKIEERLAILHTNKDLESRWDQLRELRRQYIELETELLEREKIYNILSK